MTERNKWISKWVRKRSQKTDHFFFLLVSFLICCSKSLKFLLFQLIVSIVTLSLFQWFWVSSLFKFGSIRFFFACCACSTKEPCNAHIHLCYVLQHKRVYSAKFVGHTTLNARNVHFSNSHKSSQVAYVFGIWWFSFPHIYHFSINFFTFLLNFFSLIFFIIWFFVFIVFVSVLLCLDLICKASV